MVEGEGWSKNLKFGCTSFMHDPLSHLWQIKVIEICRELTSNNLLTELIASSFAKQSGSLHVTNNVE